MGDRIVLPDGSVVVGVSAARAARLPQPRFPAATIVSPERAATIAARLTADTEPQEAGWTALLAAYSTGRTVEGPQSDPLDIPGTYTDPTGNTAQKAPLRRDANAAYNFALRYRTLGDETAATAAVAHITEWASLSGWVQDSGDNTRLAWMEYWPMFLGAAAMLDGATSYTIDVRDDVTAATNASMTALDLTGAQEPNNQGDSRIVFLMIAAAFLNDQGMFDDAVGRWKVQFDRSVNDDGDLWHEIYREGGGQGNGSHGLDYCSVALRNKVLGAEIARANGVWLYDYVSAAGHSLRALWQRIGPWIADPDTYPYDSSGGDPERPPNLGYVELIDTLWPDANSALILSENRPTSTERVVEHLTVTHGSIPLRS